MTEHRTQFDYLLNALELASQADNPAEHGYAAKRRALFAYVRELEAKAAKDFRRRPASSEAAPSAEAKTTQENSNADSTTQAPALGVAVAGGVGVQPQGPQAQREDAAAQGAKASARLNDPASSEAAPSALHSALQSTVDALDALTDKVDRTGFRDSDEFAAALDAINIGRAALAA